MTPPPVSSTDQVTLWSRVPVTVATNICCPPGGSVTVAGETVTPKAVVVSEAWLGRKVLEPL